MALVGLVPHNILLGICSVLVMRNPKIPLLAAALDVALGKEKASGDVVVLGGGKVGLTIAESLATQGHKVTIVETQKRLAGDVMPSFKWRHSAWVEELKIAAQASPSPQQVELLVDGFDRLTKLWQAAKSGLL